MTYGTLISTQTVATSGTTNVFTLSSIPQTFTDLLIVGSIRTSRANSDPGADFQLTFNSSAVSYARRSLEGTGSSTGSTTGGSTFIDGLLNDSSFATANTFGSWQIYIPNYASTTANKTVSIETVTETNAAQSFARLVAGSWANTAAITRIDLTDGNSATFMAGSTISLYGISNLPATYTGTKGTGGTVVVSGGYTYHVFTYSDTFTATASMAADILVVAGGGGGGGYGSGLADAGGGGGAGGLLAFSSQSLTAGTKYLVQVGAGGNAGVASYSGAPGSNSVFGSLTAAVGGGYGAGITTGGTAVAGGSGGSGGGAAGSSAATASGGSATSGQGNTGGASNTGQRGPGAGGGAGAVGGAGPFSGTGAAGGVGSSTYSSWGLATATGHNVSGTVYYAGGGGAGQANFTTAGVGGSGGGAGGTTTSAPSPALANTGGGGGGAAAVSNVGYAPTAGGSGIVIVRYTT